MQVVRARILSHLARRGIIEAGDDLTVLDDGFAEREPALAQLAAASVAGLAIPAGPRAYTPCPCPTRLRRARRLPAPSCAAAPPPWLCADIPASRSPRPYRSPRWASPCTLPLVPAPRMPVVVRLCASTSFARR
jgi:hypothetical protein